MKTGDKPILVPFEPQHVDWTSVQELVPQELHNALLSAYSNSGLGLTALVDNVAVCSGGVLSMWPGVGHAWLLPGPLLGEHKLWAIREMRSMLDGMTWFWRIQTFCIAEREQHKRLVKALGFEYEGTMKKYSPTGADYCIYARVRWLR